MEGEYKRMAVVSLAVACLGLKLSSDLETDNAYYPHSRIWTPITHIILTALGTEHISQFQIHSLYWIGSALPTALRAEQPRISVAAP